MGKISDALESLLPGIVPEDAYDDGFPEGIAGHVASGPFIDPTANTVRTPLGVDIGFDGSRVEDRAPREGHEGVGTEPVNEAIHKVAQESKEKDSRKPVTDTAETVVIGNMTLADAAPRRVLIRNNNRKQVTISNPGNTTIYYGKDAGISAAGPNTAYLPAGAVRTLSHKEALWIVGAAGGIMDWVEENYS